MLDPKHPGSWLWYADRSYVSTRLLWFTAFILDAPIQSHRTIELYLKALLVAQGQEVKPGRVWGHDLDQLRKHAAESDGTLDDPGLNRRVAYFQRYFDLVRYPTKLAGKLDSGQTIAFAYDANVLPLDQVVAYLRPRIPFEKPGMNLLADLYGSDDGSFQARALRDSNEYLERILSGEVTQPEDVFDTAFNRDLTGC